MGRKKAEEPFASSRLGQSAYDKAKRAAELDKISAVAFITQAVDRAAEERIARALAEVESQDPTSELASIQAKREELIADLSSYLKKKPKPKGKGGDKK